MFSSFVFFSLLFAGRTFCYDVEDEENDTSFAMNYLRQYHYISPTRSGNHDPTTAIKNFQKFFGLEVTGKLDEDTLHEMEKPRCGVPDVDVDGGRKKRYATFGKWYKTSLKYYMTYGDDISHADQARILARAFKYWRDVAPKLQFTKTEDLNQADFRISFGRRTHAGVSGERQCAYPFDGEGKVLAHAYFPTDGRIHFDDEERYTETGTSSGWWWSKKDSQSLIFVAVHEIGHALGLEHSDVKGTVMWPTASKGAPTLHQDDIDGIRSLYDRCPLRPQKGTATTLAAVISGLSALSGTNSHSYPLKGTTSNSVNFKGEYPLGGKMINFVHAHEDPRSKTGSS